MSHVRESIDSANNLAQHPRPVSMTHQSTVSREDEVHSKAWYTAHEVHTGSVFLDMSVVNLAEELVEPRSSGLIKTDVRGWANEDRLGACPSFR